MSRYIDIKAIKWAVTELKDTCHRLFVDFLILKHDGLAPLSPIVINTTSTEAAAQRLMGIQKPDGKPIDEDHVFYNPFVPGWRHRGYPRSGTYSTLDRSKTFSDIVKVEKPGIGMQLTLTEPYIAGVQDALRRAKDKTLRVPIEALAIWTARYDILPDEITLNDLVSRFVGEYHISPTERDSLFEHSVVPLETVFVDVPVDRAELIEFLSSVAPLNGAMSKPSEEETKIEELPGDLLEILRGGLLLSETVLRQLVTLVRAGKHIILTGPPGTGKSTLARQLALASEKFAETFDFPASTGHVFTTATADWSTFDTVGGYMPAADGQGLLFQEGIFLQAIKDNKWLVIDELNRADVDKAFGQLFTVLSGHSVMTPFRLNGKNVTIAFDKNEATSRLKSESNSYIVGRNWRIIATMNTFDRNLLFQLSAAFVRRFAVVHIGIPLDAELVNWLSDRELSAFEKSSIKKIISILNEKRPLGPAIWSDLSDYLEMRSQHSFAASDKSSPGEAAFAEAIIAFVLPQLDGLDRESLGVVEAELLQLFTGESEKELLSRTFKDIF